MRRPFVFDGKHVGTYWATHSDKAHRPFVSYGKYVGTSWATRSDKARHPLTYWSRAFMNARRPLLVTESKIVTPFSKNYYIEAQCAHNSHK
jgi:hypothetical protein